MYEYEISIAHPIGKRINTSMSSTTDSMSFPQRVLAISCAASATPGATLAFKDATKDHLTMPALAALCRHYGLEVEGNIMEDAVVPGPSDDSTPFARRILNIAHACGGEWGPRDTKHSPLAGEALDSMSIPALRGVAIRYGLAVGGVN